MPAWVDWINKKEYFYFPNRTNASKGIARNSFLMYTETKRFPLSSHYMQKLYVKYVFEQSI